MVYNQEYGYLWLLNQLARVDEPVHTGLCAMKGTGFSFHTFAVEDTVGETL